MPFFPYPDALLLPSLPYRQPLPTSQHVEYDILNTFAQSVSTQNDTPDIRPYTGTPVAVVVLSSGIELDEVELLTISQGPSALNLDDVVFAEIVLSADTPSSIASNRFRIKAFHKHIPVERPGTALSIAACWSLLNRGCLCPIESTVTQVPHKSTVDGESVQLNVSSPFNPKDPVILLQADLSSYTSGGLVEDLTCLQSLVSTSLRIVSASSVDMSAQTYLFIQLPFQDALDRLDPDPEVVADVVREFSVARAKSSSAEIQKTTVVFWAGLKTGSVGKKRDVLTRSKAYTQTGQHEGSSDSASLALALTFVLAESSLTPANGKTRYSLLEGHNPPNGRQALFEGSLRLDRGLVQTVSLGGRVGLTAQGWILRPWSDGKSR